MNFLLYTTTYGKSGSIQLNRPVFWVPALLGVCTLLLGAAGTGYLLAGPASGLSSSTAGGDGMQWQAALDEVQQLVAQPPPDGPQRLFALWQQLAEPRGPLKQPESALHRFREIVGHLMDYWPEYVLYQHKEDVPSTNNGTERAIGRWRSRARTVRGFKSWTGLEAAFLLRNSTSP